MITTTRYEAAEFGGPIRAVPRDLPDPTGTEVVVKVSHCGVCHTDLHVHHGGYEIGDGKELRFEDRGVHPPLTLGHEIVGRVVAAGPDADAVPDKAIAVYPWVGCGSCFRCQAGEDHLCSDARFLGIFAPGGYASHVVVPHPRYLFDIGGLDPASAALLGCSGLTSFGALGKIANLPKDAAILIIGAGGLGQTVIALARQMGWNQLVALDIDADKRTLAMKAGAAVAVDPTSTDIAGLKEIAEAPILAALDFVGSETTADLAIQALEKGGSLVMVGLFGGEFRYPLPLIAIRALTVVGSYVGSLNDMADYVAHVRAHGAPELPIEERPMEAAGDVLTDLAKGAIAGRTVLVNSISEKAK
ncbi:MAG: alcohol dehydrogenase [Cohaesibacteraceae bacterium]